MVTLFFYDLCDIIDFIYHGEISVAKNNIIQFLEIAEELKLKDVSKSSYVDMLDNEQWKYNEPDKEYGETTIKEKYSVWSTKSNSY